MVQILRSAKLRWAWLGRVKRTEFTGAEYIGHQAAQLAACRAAQHYKFSGLSLPALHSLIDRLVRCGLVATSPKSLD